MTVTGSDIDDASAVASSTECAACEFIVGEIEKLLAKNSSEMAVRWLCALVDCGGDWLCVFVEALVCDFWLWHFCCGESRVAHCT